MKHRVDIVGGVVRLSERNAVSRSKRAKPIDVLAIRADPRAYDRWIQRPGSTHQIEDVRSSISVRIRQEHGMQALIESLP